MRTAAGEPLVPERALQPDRRKATYVVYTRASSFPALLSSLRAYYAQHTNLGVEIFLWLDVLCLPQAPPPPPRAALAAVEPLLHSAASVVVVLDENAELFGRAWCLFEIAAVASAVRARSARWLHVVPIAFQGDELQLIDAVFAASMLTARCSEAGDYEALVAALSRMRPPLEAANVGAFVADTIWEVLSQQILRAAAVSKSDASSFHSLQERTPRALISCRASR